MRNESNPGSNPEPRFHLPSSEVRDTEGELSAIKRQRDCNTRGGGDSSVVRAPDS